MCKWFLKQAKYVAEHIACSHATNYSHNNLIGQLDSGRFLILS